MSLQKNLRWRYAVKKFDTDRVVNDGAVDAILEAGNLTASSFGLQPYQFVVVKNQDLQDRLVTSSYGQNQVAEASHVIVLATRTDVDDRYISDYTAMIEGDRDLPVGAMNPYRDMMIGAVGQMSDDHRQGWAARQAYIVLGSMLAACADLEVDSCPMEGFVQAEYNEILRLDQHHLNAVIVLPIGYRSEEDKHQHYKKVRKQLNDIVLRIDG